MMRVKDNAKEVRMTWLSARSIPLTFPALAAVAVLASGCGNSVESVAGNSDKVTTVPITVEALIGYSYNITPVPGECVAPLTRRTGLDLSTGTSNQGWATVVAEHCNSAAGTAAGVATMTAAGTAADRDFAEVLDDQVWLSYTVAASGITVVSSSPLIVRFQAPFHVTGGTGRFTNAGGEGTLTCTRTTPITTTNLPAHTPAYSNYYECSLDGMISTVAPG
jgi:hypothetical protein